MSFGRESALGGGRTDSSSDESALGGRGVEHSLPLELPSHQCTCKSHFSSVKLHTRELLVLIKMQCPLEGP